MTSSTGWPPSPQDEAEAALRSEVRRLADDQALMREQLDAVLAVVIPAAPTHVDIDSIAEPYPAPRPRVRGLGHLIVRDI